jgi:cytoskeleton protein RodZ
VKFEEPLPAETEESLPPEKTSPELRSQIVFTRIGKALQERREALSLTMDEIEDHTHVRKHYLQALELGRFDHLPSSVQTRGMLNNYAHFLDMDVDVILLQFAEGLQAQRLERQPPPAGKAKGTAGKPPSKANPPSGLRRYLSVDVIVGVGLVVILLVFAIWGTSRVISLRSANTPQPTTQPISDILAAIPGTGTDVPAPANETSVAVIIPEVSSTAVVTVSAAGQGPVQVVLVALEQAFVRVTVDGKRMFDGRVTAGGAYPFDGKNQIEVLTGNGAAISVLFNQSDLGPMGSIGEVVNRIYTANAILNPTATITPSPTITPTPTVTPRPTLTPLPGITPPSPTPTPQG